MSYLAKGRTTLGQLAGSQVFEELTRRPLCFCSIAKEMGAFPPRHPCIDPKSPETILTAGARALKGGKGLCCDFDSVQHVESSPAGSRWADPARCGNSLRLVPRSGLRRFVLLQPSCHLAVAFICPQRLGHHHGAS